jgi:hypothetical protein
VQVTWLASWTENVQGQVKYVMLNPSSKLKGEKDWQKYETARKLAKCIGKIRQEYQDDFKSKEMRIRQRAVALYFIDKVTDICYYFDIYSPLYVTCGGQWTDGLSRYWCCPPFVCSFSDTDVFMCYISVPSYFSPNA